MSRERKTPLRIKVLTSIVAAGVLAWVVGQQFETTVAAQQSNFVGGSPSQLDVKAVRTLRLRFPAGSRSNWHSHSHGQLLMVEQGRGRTQERGGPLLEMGPGQPWHTKPGIEHWHGAAPDQEVIQLTIYEGAVKWLEAVSNEVYKAAPGARPSTMSTLAGRAASVQEGAKTLLQSSKIMAFVATADAKRARAYYEGTLGMRLLSDEPFAIVFDANGTMLRIAKVGKLTPAAYTVLGWEVGDIRAMVTELKKRGVIFEVIRGFDQDDLGIWTAPDGTKVAWFRDPEGNTLSVTQFR